jgi:hypothetical protein
VDTGRKRFIALAPGGANEEILREDKTVSVATKTKINLTALTYKRIDL